MTSRSGRIGALDTLVRVGSTIPVYAPMIPSSTSCLLAVSFNVIKVKDLLRTDYLGEVAPPLNDWLSQEATHPFVDAKDQVRGLLVYFLPVLS
jgi:hypothetical protein